jgi:hypothetical protein
MPEGDEEHGRVTLTPAIALSGCHQLLDLTLGSVFTRPKLGVRTAERRNCPIYFVRRDPMCMDAKARQRTTDIRWLRRIGGKTNISSGIWSGYAVQICITRSA